MAFMCGIVGLFLKDPALESELGSMLADMLEELGDRGPDSTGVAVYGRETPGRWKLTVRLPADLTGPDLAAALGEALNADIAMEARGVHALFLIPAEIAGKAVHWLRRERPDVVVVGEGRRMELYKDVGRPETVTARIGLRQAAGTHGVGHTRMATESAVTIDGAHPFSTGPDQCLVHNGSLSNHNDLRRRLRREGFSFRTENDTEVAAGYLSWRMTQGSSLGEALEASLADLDGFYTFVVGAESGFGVLRDTYACKPAVMAETGRYVAFGTEYRALAGLPGIDGARVWEPEPRIAYFWENAA
jgi:methylamine---glutamate N-methyltransferase subunit A